MSHVHVINRTFVDGLGQGALNDYPESKDEAGEFIGDIVNTYLKGTVKKGDALVFENLGYRGSNVYFWDGTHVILAGTNYADEGNVPEEFLVQNGKFSPDYWSELIEMSKAELHYQHFTELTLGRKLQDELRTKAAQTPCIVKVVINGKEFSFFIQKNDSKEDIEDSWFYYVGNNTVVQADVDAHGDTDWHPEAQGFVGILERMRALQGGKRNRSRGRGSHKKNKKATRRSRK